jgi:uncharacterized membrane protein YvbJ
MYCIHCGANNPANATFCQKCGKQLDTTNQEDATVLTAPPAPASPYNSNARTSSPYDTSEPISAPPPPLGQPSGARADTSIPQLLPIAQRPKSRRGYIIALALAVLVVLAAVGTYVYVNRSTPNNTLTTYCTALERGDYQTAYNQLSSGLQNSITEARFAQEWQQSVGAIKSWTVNNLQEQGSTATAQLTFTLSNGRMVPATIILISENGQWKVNSETIG